jgi:FtsZ-binding cell division protein ZapB
VPHQPTEAEAAEMERVAEIERLKEQLAATDYKAIKHAEGWLTADEYAPIKEQRQQWRARINELEGGGDR